MISGSGLAIAKTIGLGAITFIISFVKAPFTDRPKATSAPFKASDKDLFLVETACADFH